VLRLAMLTFAAVSILVGLTSWWPVVALLLTLEYFAVVMWNVVTVSLRQAIIPDALLGRVNSVYRFVAWGAMPIGAVLGGAVVAVAGRFTTRETALRLPWWIAGAVYAVVVVVFALPRLTSASVEAARADAAGARNSDPPGR
jgi:MFS family permease